jgi:hypothetical protein
MKRIVIVLSMLLACVSFSAADTITLNDGSGAMVGSLLSPFPTYHFVFVGGHDGIGIDGIFGDFPYVPGLQQCIQYDPGNLRPILEDSGMGIDHFGRLFTGHFDFEAVSFVSSLAPNGMLTVIYTATARMTFTFCTNPDVCNGNHLVWNTNRLWLVTANFAPDSNVPGTWDFLNATFTPAPTPEPSSILLVGSGIMALIAKLRKTAKTTHDR